jgi:hypothetical protein
MFMAVQLLGSSSHLTDDLGLWPALCSQVLSALQSVGRCPAAVSILGWVGGQRQ